MGFGCLFKNLEASRMSAAAASGGLYPTPLRMPTLREATEQRGGCGVVDLRALVKMLPVLPVALPEPEQARQLLRPTVLVTCSRSSDQKLCRRWWWWGRLIQTEF